MGFYVAASLLRPLQHDALNHDDDLESTMTSRECTGGAPELMAPVSPASASKYEHQGISLQSHHWSIWLQQMDQVKSHLKLFQFKLLAAPAHLMMSSSQRLYFLNLLRDKGWKTYIFIKAVPVITAQMDERGGVGKALRPVSCVSATLTPWGEVTDNWEQISGQKTVFDIRNDADSFLCFVWRREPRSLGCGNGSSLWSRGALTSPAVMCGELSIFDKHLGLVRKRWRANAEEPHSRWGFFFPQRSWILMKW